jgi:hypothetical protein
MILCGTLYHQGSMPEATRISMKEIDDNTDNKVTTMINVSSSKEARGKQANNSIYKLHGRRNFDQYRQQLSRINSDIKPWLIR